MPGRTNKGPRCDASCGFGECGAEVSAIAAHAEAFSPIRSVEGAIWKNACRTAGTQADYFITFRTRFVNTITPFQQSKDHTEATLSRRSGDDGARHRVR